MQFGFELRTKTIRIATITNPHVVRTLSATRRFALRKHQTNYFASSANRNFFKVGGAVTDSLTLIFNLKHQLFLRRATSPLAGR